MVKVDWHDFSAPSKRVALYHRRNAGVCVEESIRLRTHDLFAIRVERVETPAC
ncbi:hypothetical protein [Tumebacillus permanentifrigoris]|uniref:hypothetical protein n=1 Tax=Tumebacillus permanentifrigoris TaxID=378543 RepID=UPI0014751B21|nr:hypothetical protein [Tumebacillus permanentifrigoris]